MGGGAVIPSMGGDKIGETLRHYAAAVPPGQAIVEVGCWLGAGTAHLAAGAVESGAPLHVYDRWRAMPSEVGKAAKFGVHLEEGQNTLPLAKAAVQPFGAEVFWHRGEVGSAKWCGQSIGLYVDDASKQRKIWARSAATFLPHVVIGGVLILMDFHFYEKRGEKYRAQKRYMDARRDQYEMIGSHLDGTVAAVFRRLC